MKIKRAVFLDRDGTLNRDVGYPAHWSQIHIYPYAFEAIRRIHAAGLAAVVVTNQSGVGRGCFGEDDLQALHHKFAAAFSKRQARLDAFYYCPHYSPHAPADLESGCACRKPNSAMGLQAAAELGLSLEGSYMVGDKMADILFGLNIGAVPVLVLTGYGRESLAKIERGAAGPAHVARTLAAAVDWIVGREQRASRPRVSSPGKKGGP